MRSFLDSAYVGLYIVLHYAAVPFHKCYRQTVGRVLNVVSNRLDAKRHASMLEAAKEIFKVTLDVAPVKFDEEQKRQVVQVLLSRESHKQQASQTWFEFEQSPANYIANHTTVPILLEDGPAPCRMVVDRNPLRLDASIRKVSSTLEDNVDMAVRGYNRAVEVAEYFDPALVRDLDFVLLLLGDETDEVAGGKLRLIK